MSVLGHIRVQDFLEKTKGAVRGQVVTDAKDRTYSADYAWSETHDGFLLISRKNGTGDEVKIKPIIELDESLVAFFGLYSGDGAKGSEDVRDPQVIRPVISFSQREPNLVRFAVEQFRKFFPEGIRFSFSLGEDSAFFMDGEGLEMLRDYYGGCIPPTPPLDEVKSTLDNADRQYLQEERPVLGTNEDHLAFNYFHRDAMKTILTGVKMEDLRKSGVVLDVNDNVTASLRRPFKKGARELGGSSRSDEIHVGGLKRFGELFLKMLHEIEESIYDDSQVSTQGLVQWLCNPSEVGDLIDIKQFFSSHAFGRLANKRPEIDEEANFLIGKWPRSSRIRLNRTVRIDPLFCYVSGLYLAEGSTPKSEMFAMFTRKVKKLSLAFTSSEDISINLVLRSLQRLFRKSDCVTNWKVKVGSQYFPELVVIGLKSGVPMLRGGKSGDGKLRTMEISMAVKSWALEVAPSLVPFEDKYSHVEPTGAGLARIDFSASSALCRWYFPLLIYAAFGNIVERPSEDFVYD